VLDGQGGDELLDTTLAPGTDFLRQLQLGRLGRLLRANRAYTGEPKRAALRRIAGSLRSKRGVEPSLPGWLAPDPTLRRAILERHIPPPGTYAEIREADLLDPYLAHVREETFAAGARHGIGYRHPLWDAEVVELLHGLPPEALIAGGRPKSPARAYVRGGVVAIAGGWPQPAVADDLLEAVLAAEAQAAWARIGGLRVLGELGIVDETHSFGFFPARASWTMLCMEFWLRSIGGRE